MRLRTRCNVIENVKRQNKRETAICKRGSGYIVSGYGKYRISTRTGDTVICERGSGHIVNGHGKCKISE
jgi:hypothetical protein